MQPMRALIVIDVQNSLMTLDPYKSNQLIEHIQALIQQARHEQCKVIYVRHCDQPGSGLEPGEEGWQIFEAIGPLSEDLIIDKRYNSAFKETDLHQILQNAGIEELMLVGMQVEYCIDATLKSAFDLGYKIVVPEGATSTFDNDLFSAKDLYLFYTQYIWHQNFAQVLSFEQSLNWLKN